MWSPLSCAVREILQIKGVLVLKTLISRIFCGVVTQLQQGGTLRGVQAQVAICTDGPRSGRSRVQHTAPDINKTHRAHAR